VLLQRQRFIVLSSIRTKMVALVGTIADFMAVSLPLIFEHLVILYHTWMVSVCL
jgi:hypothetical protein